MSVQWKALHESGGDSRVVEDTSAQLLVAEGLSPQVAVLLAIAPDLLALVQRLAGGEPPYAIGLIADARALLRRLDGPVTP